MERKMKLKPGDVVICGCLGLGKCAAKIIEVIEHKDYTTYSMKIIRRAGCKYELPSFVGGFNGHAKYVGSSNKNNRCYMHSDTCKDIELIGSDEE
jgi:hypothetical protein